MTVSSEPREGKGEIVLYQTSDGNAALEVRLEGETLWLSLAQIAGLFERDKSVISRHLSNIFRTGELERKAVVAFFATTAADGKTYQVEYFNLDATLSVGYRVNSKRGTQFRIWATNVLRDHIVRGYSLNEKRLQVQTERLAELQTAVGLMGRVLDQRSLATDEATGLLQVIRDYVRALDLLDGYDYQRLTITDTTAVERGFALSYEMARGAIEELRRQSSGASDLFGREKDDSLKAALGGIYQSFGGRDLYPSVEEKAAHLLYFVIKNHAFIDGNKRIGAFLFLWFLDRHGALYATNGGKRLADSALVALTLLIAESRPQEKDLMIKLIVNLINKRN